MPTTIGRPSGVVDNLHGVEVHDPYRWLEDRDHPATEQWIAEQQALLDCYVDKLGSLDNLKSRIRGYLDVDKVDQIGKVGDRYFYRQRLSGSGQQPIIYCKRDKEQGRALVNTEALGPFASAGIHRISSDGRLLAYELKEGGEHSKEIYVIDVDSGERWPEFLPRGLARGFAFSESVDGFYYCHDAQTTGRGRDIDYQICHHRKGTSFDQDRVLFSIPREGLGKLLLRVSGGTLSAVYCHTGTGGPNISLWAATESADHIWKPIYSNKATPFAPFFHRGRLFAVIASDNGNSQIAEFNPSNGHFLRIIVPPWHLPLQDCVVAGASLFSTYLDGWNMRIQEWSLDGRYCHTLELDEAKSWMLLPTHSAETNELFLQSESFTEPPSFLKYSVLSQAWEMWSSRPHHPFAASSKPHRFTYQGKDGTAVDITILGPEDEAELRFKPVVMTAYGSSGISLTPQFSAFVLVMRELGFIFALPSIRGGGEHGREWHEAARGGFKQVAFDDFIAAGEWLVAQGFTSPEKLAIFGGSFSGLLVGAVLCQRPRLFGAVLCIAPLLDMLRYHLFDRAFIWSSEFGTAEAPEEFSDLYRYSPYHHVEPDICYPPVYFVCGEKDTRCNPAHVRKMAARLQGRPVQERSILVDHSAERGHSPTLPVTAKIDSLARRIAFICNEVGVAYTSKETHALPHL